jgi:hypothetical protein
MTLEKMIQACSILKKYTDEEKPSDPFFYAEHDEIFFPGPDDPSDVSDEDTKILDDLGVHYSDETDSWAAFV